MKVAGRLAGWLAGGQNIHASGAVRSLTQLLAVENLTLVAVRCQGRANQLASVVYEQRASERSLHKQLAGSNGRGVLYGRLSPAMINVRPFKRVSERA